MSELVEASLRFPTVIFSIGLGIALVYWAFVLLGALDIDVLGTGDASVAAKGGAEALKGHDADLLGLGRVPLTISLSVVLLGGWCASLLGNYYGTRAFGDHLWIPIAVLLLALLVALPVAAVCVKPLAPLFAVREGKSNKDYIGHTCTVTTGHVDDNFGQATVEDGGTVLVIAVRCDRPGALTRGAKALIVDFDPARQAYLVDLPVT